VSHGRYREVTRVLVQVLVLNVSVAAAKIGYGYYSGAISILSDGFHSLADSLSNVAALVGIRVARKPPDDDHPYGHRKYETLAAGLIAGFLVLVIVEVTELAWGRLRHGVAPEVTPAAFVVMAATVLVNLGVTTYERRKATALASEVLFADAMHTRSDVYASLTVIAALAGAWLGYPVFDPLAALVVVVFIAHAGWEIAVSTSNILADRIVIGEEELRQVVLGVPGVLGCHRIRTRGSEDHVFLDLHVWMHHDLRLDAAHEKSHVVKDRLIERFPQIADAIIHIEPPPRGWDEETRKSERGARN
jgi:cation diffusion facilitator family transporter